ncbi:hypothetical protein [Streptomyces sp. NPDC090021]
MPENASMRTVSMRKTWSVPTNFVPPTVISALWWLDVAAKVGMS